MAYHLLYDVMLVVNEVIGFAMRCEEMVTMALSVMFVFWLVWCRQGLIQHFSEYVQPFGSFLSSHVTHFCHFEYLVRYV